MTGAAVGVLVIGLVLLLGVALVVAGVRAEQRDTRCPLDTEHRAARNSGSEGRGTQ